jgi:hypothetical protein
MSARVALSALLLAAFALPTLGPASDPASGPSRARAGAWSLERGEYSSTLQTSVYTANSLYDVEGKRYAYPGPGKLQQIGLSWHNEIGWRKKLGLRIGVSGLSVVGFNAPPLFSPAQSGLSELELGLHYKIANGNRAAAIEAGWSGPAGFDRQLSRGLGDGRHEFYGRLNVGSAIGTRGFLELSGGGAYRFHKIGSGDSQSNLDPRLTTNVYYDFGADLGLWIRPSLLLGGRYRGRILSSTTGVGDLTNVHWVGPMQLRGDSQIDESVQLAGPLLMFRVDDRIDLIAGSNSTAMGKNTPHFDQFYVTLAFKQSKLKRNQGYLGGSAP